MFVDIHRQSDVLIISVSLALNGSLRQSDQMLFVLLALCAQSIFRTLSICDLKRVVCRRGLRYSESGVSLARSLVRPLHDVPRHVNDLAVSGLCSI